MPYGGVFRPFSFPSQQLDFGFGFNLKNALAIEPYCTLQILDVPFSIAGRIGLNFLFFHNRKQKT
ncbi:hypothetical protein FACS1894178_1780 [Bacteroidia bacterium]|nr:hypothetical protein FACS1894178_1780 [Bacteroidia bacterium]